MLSLEAFKTLYNSVSEDNKLLIQKYVLENTLPQTIRPYLVEKDRDAGYKLDRMLGELRTEHKIYLQTHTPDKEGLFVYKIRETLGGEHISYSYETRHSGFGTFVIDLIPLAEGVQCFYTQGTTRIGTRCKPFLVSWDQIKPFLLELDSKCHGRETFEEVLALLK